MDINNIQQQSNLPKFTVDEFGERIKKRRPDLQYIPNHQLVHRILVRYPQYGAVLTDKPNPAYMTQTEKTAQEANEFLNKNWIQRVFTKQTAKELPSAAHSMLKDFATPVPQFAVSAFKAPVDFVNYIKSGGFPEYYQQLANQQIKGTFLTNPFQTIQSETAKELVEKPNMTPSQKLGLIVRKGVKTGWEGAATLGALKPITGDIGVISRPEISVKVPTWVDKSGKFVIVPDVQAGKVYPGLIENAAQAARSAAQNINKKLELKRAEAVLGEPKLTPKEKIIVLEKAGQPGGVTIQKGKITIKPTAQDEKMFEIAAQAGVNPKDPVSVNLLRLRSYIAKTGQDTENFVATHGTQLTPELKNELIQKINNINSTLIGNSAGSATLEQIKQDIINRYISDVQNTHDLYLTRQILDNDIVNQFSENIYKQVGSKNLANVISQIRRIINDYVANTTANPEYFYNNLNQEHLLYRAIKILAKKGGKEIYTSAFQRFLKLHPTIKTAAKLAGAGAGIDFILNRIRQAIREGSGNSYSNYNY